MHFCELRHLRLNLMILVDFYNLNDSVIPWSGRRALLMSWAIIFSLNHKKVEWKRPLEVLNQHHFHHCLWWTWSLSNLVLKTSKNWSCTIPLDSLFHCCLEFCWSHLSNLKHPSCSLWYLPLVVFLLLPKWIWVCQHSRSSLNHGGLLLDCLLTFPLPH